MKRNTLIIKTSQTHPLQIAEVSLAGNCGEIGITFCPGKKQHSAFSGQWHRDLDLDLDAVSAWGAAAVVTLIEDHEIASLEVKGLGAAVGARHMTWFHLPIPDVSVPCSRFETQWEQRGEAIRSLLPAPLRSAVQAGPIEEGHWCLLVSSNAVAAKLRQFIPSLQMHLESKGLPVTGIRIKVQSRTL